MVFIYKCIHGYGIKHSNNYKHTKRSILVHRAKHLTIVPLTYISACFFPVENWGYKHLHLYSRFFSICHHSECSI